MKDKIIKEALDWYDQQEEKPDILIEDFLDIVIDKTADALLEKIKDGLKEEFEKGNLKHPFIISNEYYLYLKLKDIKIEALEEWKKRAEQSKKEKEKD